jgi:hypothetical protein
MPIRKTMAATSALQRDAPLPHREASEFVKKDPRFILLRTFVSYRYSFFVH